MILENICPVCGYEMEYAPRDFNICPSCGTEFGVNDVNASINELRSAWLRNGARWWSPVDSCPVGWDPYEQINTLLAKPRKYAGPIWFVTGLQRMISPQDYRQEDAPFLQPAQRNETAALGVI
jgi:hypothetical protein